MMKSNILQQQNKHKKPHTNIHTYKQKRERERNCIKQRSSSTFFLFVAIFKDRKF